MRDSDWSRKFLLRSDWLGPSVALSTTYNSELLLNLFLLFLRYLLVCFVVVVAAE